MLHRVLAALCLSATSLCAPFAAAQNTLMTDAEVRIMDPRGILLPADFVVVKNSEGIVISPSSTLTGTFAFVDVGPKITFEFASRHLKNNGFELVLEPAPKVFVTMIVDPTTGRVKSVAQKPYFPKSNPLGKIRKMPGGQQAPLGPGPANDDCADAIPIFDGATAFSTVGATTDGPANGSCQFDGQTYEDIWYVYSATCTGTLTVSTCNTINYDSDLVVYDGLSCVTPLLLGCNDDFPGCTGFSSMISVPVTSGNPYLIRIGGFASGDEGSGTVSCICSGPPANDECAMATSVTCGSSTALDNSAASTSGSDPAFSCAFGGSAQGAGTLWLTFVATATSAFIDTNASLISDTLLAVYSGSCGSLVEIGCSDDEGIGFLSQVCVSGLTIGNTYTIQVASFSGSSQGPITVSITCPGPCAPLGNDDCSGAETLPCNSGVTFDNSGASTDPLDPAYSCIFGGPAQGTNTVWFKFVATATSAQLDTNASLGATDTVLGVYDGTCGAFAELACDDDGGVGLLSKLCVEGLLIGHTYYVQVASFDAFSVGEITLGLTCPCPSGLANDDCTGAQDLGGLPASVVFDNSAATDDISVPCGVFSGPFFNVWFKVTGTGNVLRATTCNGGTVVDDTKISVFCADCAVPTCVTGNDDDCPGGGPFFASTVNWCSQAGATYFITVGTFSPFTIPGIIQLDVTDTGTGCVADVVCLPQGACCLEDETCVVTTVGDCAAQNGTYQGDGTDCFSNAVADGGFEAGVFGGVWTELSTNFGTPICDAFCGFGGGSGPRSGSFWSWLGGIFAFEEGSVAQSVTIPSTASTLDFYLEIPVSSGNGADFLEVLIDGNQVYLTLESDGPYIGYALVSIPLGAFADGGSHSLEFHSIITGDDGGGGPALTNFFVDDISINSQVVDCSPPQSCFTLDFQTDDSGAPLVHGQHIDTEFLGGPNYPVTITSSVNASGSNSAAILNSNTGPANQDPDLLVGSGNILILQTDANLNECPPNSGIYCSHNDDEDGGTLSFVFNATTTPASIDLIDIDATDPVSSVVLIGVDGRTRTYTVPANWTGDLVTNGPPAIGTLDLTALVPQPGFGSTATVSEDAGFDLSLVIQIDVHLGGSGAVDNLIWCQSQ